MTVKWKSVHFKMPEEDLLELRDFISKWSDVYPSLSISQMMRRGVENEMRKIKEDTMEYRESYEATKLYENVIHLLREEGWERREVPKIPDTVTAAAA
jgi:hypothetical protein